MHWKRFVQCCSVRNMVIMTLLYISFTIFKKRYFVKQLASFTCFIIIVVFLENATLKYLLESVCVFPCLCVCVFFLHDNSKRNRSRDTKLEYIVLYENSSDEFNIELRQIKVKVTVGVQKFPHLPQYKLSGPVVQLWYKLQTLYKASMFI